MDPENISLFLSNLISFFQNNKFSWVLDAGYCDDNVHDNVYKIN